MDHLTGARKSPFFEWGVASRPLAGTQSGDLSVVLPFPGGILIGALDGLGHGDEAAAAAGVACAVLRTEPDAPLIRLIRRCHEALIETRGVVMSLASFSASDGLLTWIGVGNVEGLLMRTDPTAGRLRETLLLRGGVVGYNLPLLSASVIPMLRGDTLVFTTDGIRTGFAAGVAPSDTPQQLANRILDQYAKGTDDALALVAVFHGETA